MIFELCVRGVITGWLLASCRAHPVVMFPDLLIQSRLPFRQGIGLVSHDSLGFLAYRVITGTLLLTLNLRCGRTMLLPLLLCRFGILIINAGEEPSGIAAAGQTVDMPRRQGINPR